MINPIPPTKIDREASVLPARETQPAEPSQNAAQEALATYQAVAPREALAAYEVCINVAPAPDTPSRCMATFHDNGIQLSSLTLMWDDDRTDRQILTVRTQPTCSRVVKKAAEELSPGGSPRIIRLER